MMSEQTPRTDEVAIDERDGVTHPDLCETYVAWTDYWALRERSRQIERELTSLQQKLEKVTRAFPHCEEHKPDGGTRGGCLVCALIKLSAALSRIDYLCGEPNEMQTSGYDVHCNEEAVIRNVERTLEDAEMKLTAQLKTAGEWLAAKDAEIDRLSAALKRAQDAEYRRGKIAGYQQAIAEYVFPLLNRINTSRETLNSVFDDLLTDEPRIRHWAEREDTALADEELERRIRDNYNDPRVATMIATAESNSDTQSM